MEHDRKLVIKVVRSLPSLLFLHLSACFDPDHDCSKINILFPEGAAETHVLYLHDLCRVCLGLHRELFLGDCFRNHKSGG